MRALDLYCCAGGATRGLQWAGFHVVGVDILPQPNYCGDAFIQGDALEQSLDGYDFVWASPPCQAHSDLARLNGKSYECFIERTRAKLTAWGGLWIMENVSGAPLQNPTTLCGSAFGLPVWRHRLFESNVMLLAPGCAHALAPEPIDVTGMGTSRKGPRMDGKGGNSRKPSSLTQARAALGIDWMSRRELSQAIPPAYSHFLARQIMQALGICLKCKGRGWYLERFADNHATTCSDCLGSGNQDGIATKAASELALRAEGDGVGLRQSDRAPGIAWKPRIDSCMKTITTSPAHAHHPTLRHPPVGFRGGQVAFQREGGERAAYQGAVELSGGVEGHADTLAVDARTIASASRRAFSEYQASPAQLSRSYQAANLARFEALVDSVAG